MENNSSKVKINILFFAKVRELVEQPSIQLTVEKELSLSRLFSEICNKFPSLSSLNNSLIFALNQNYINNLEEVLSLNDDDELALIPPISGG